jgi:hypothetical protein
MPKKESKVDALPAESGVPAAWLKERVHFSGDFHA